MPFQSGYCNRERELYCSEVFRLNSAKGVAVLLLVLSGSALTSAASTDPFDAPVEKKIVDFGPSPYYGPGTDIHVRLSCYIYPAFMVKQYDEGQKGAEWLAVAPMEKGAVPQCAKSHEPGEWVLDNEKEWHGYFKGVKGNLVFFVAADGADGGMPFAVFDPKTRRKIFEDSYFYAGMWNVKFKDSPFNDIRVQRTANGQVSLKYLRVVGTEYDLHTARAPSWGPLRKRLGIKTIQKPACLFYAKGSWGPSVVAYPVEVSLFPKPVRKNIEGPVRCWSVD